MGYTKDASRNSSNSNVIDLNRFKIDRLTKKYDLERRSFEDLKKRIDNLRHNEEALRRLVRDLGVDLDTGRSTDGNAD